MRAAAPILVLAATLAAVPAAGADLTPVRRDGPRVRAGTVQVPAGHASGRVTVIVRMALPPLAQARV
ncbi:MAG TPA: hypothetical protein VLN26_04780, partial [Gaiellaceae bacterium]|nr:hypothetical protein [Gaiellaceae bacterium]